MSVRLFQHRSIWWPTWLGWLLLAVLGGIPVLLWALLAEDFFGRTERIPAEALIVEGWIGIEGVRAAQAEFEQGGYRYLITAGALSDSRWNAQRWNYATESAKLLRQQGVPADRVIEAPARETPGQRTFQAAITVRQILAERGLTIQSANVFTLGAHARRSRLIFSKALPETKVGMISWRPAADFAGPWWHSSERAESLLKETAGYTYEVLLNSGRRTNSPPPAP